MLQLPAYRLLLMHESRRVRSDSMMSDVYDSPRWREKVGEPTDNLERIALQYCVDAIPAFNRKQSGSVKPAQFINLSLPPWLRYQARHMMVHMLIPAHLKGKVCVPTPVCVLIQYSHYSLGKQARKYYDWSASYEMNDMHRLGVDGVRVLLYGVTLDSPGRRELLSMTSVSSFYPCPHCLHTAQPGLHGQVYGGFRRFLDINSPWRQRSFVYKGHTYMFRDVELRETPPQRTDKSVTLHVALARPNHPFCGHKSAPFLHRWLGADWERSVCDVMHDIKCMCEMFLKGLVGYGPDGMYKSWSRSKDNSHRDDCEVYGIFDDFHTDTNSLPPWRLSRDAVHVMDMRVRSMWWPHYMDKLCKKHHSFWTHSDRMWKAVHKFYIMMVILPTCLHGFVPAVHTAILTIVNALRQLDGQVLSSSEAAHRGVLPAARVIDEASLPRLHEELVRGLVLLEGSFPVAHLNPAMHHLVHYATQTARVALLRWFAMWSFERNNKKVKGLVTNTSQPLATLANNLQMDIATRFLSYVQRSDSQFEESAPVCALYSRIKFYRLSQCERFDLGLLGVTSCLRVRAFNIARILGVHFKAGEWGRRRCGSVVTTMHAGRSRYCTVEKFLRVQGQSFARVTWLSKPKYPYAPIRLVVRVRMLPHQQQVTHRCLISIDKIAPCSVAVIPDTDGIHFFMLRDKGYDRVLRR